MQLEEHPERSELIVKNLKNINPDDPNIGEKEILIWTLKQFPKFDMDLRLFEIKLTDIAIENNDLELREIIINALKKTISNGETRYTLIPSFEELKKVERDI